MIQLKENNCWFNKVGYQQQEESIETQGGNEILIQKDVYCFPAIYKMSGCIFIIALPLLETQVSPTVIAVHTISPWIFFKFMVLQLMAESAHIHIPPAFSLSLPRPALPWLF